jgi:hypothetical protein
MTLTYQRFTAVLLLLIDGTMQSMHNGKLPIPHDQNIPLVQIKCKNNAADFFDIRGIVYYKFVPNGQSTKFTIWKYWKGCVKKLDGNDPKILLMILDNAPAHTALSVREFLGTKK